MRLESIVEMLSPRSVYRRLVDGWSAVSSATHGQYSVARLEELYEYQTHTPMWRVLLVCGLTPVLAIMLIILTDAMPLQDPTRGLRYSHLLWLRLFVSVLCVVGPSLLQVRFVIPDLDISPREVAILSTISSLASVATEYVLAIGIGYPVPFGLVLGTPACFSVMVAGVILPRRQLLESSPELRKQLTDYVAVWICQISLTAVYPMYNYLFSQLASHAQTVFVLLLPVLKLFHKRWLCHLLRDADDLKPEVVVFNIEVFNALYVAACMQSSRSINTTIALMAIDFLQAWYSARKVAKMLDEVNALLEKVQCGSAATDRPSDRPILQVVVDALAGDAPLRKKFTARRAHFVDATSKTRRGTWFTKPAGPALVSIHPAPQETTVRHGPCAAQAHSDNTVLPAAETHRLSSATQHELVEMTLRLLFVTEFAVLVEYTEVIMPIIYNACSEGMVRLRNRQYYLPLAGKTDEQHHQTFNNVALYASLEFVSFVAFGLLLRWKLRFSVLTQVAFVLERQFVMVQSKLVMWTFYVVQTSLQHFGADFSFSFAWLQFR